MGNFNKAIKPATTTEVTKTIAPSDDMPELNGTAKAVEPIDAVDDEEAALLAEEVAIEKELRLMAIRRKIADGKLAKAKAEAELSKIVSATSEASAELAALSVTLNSTMISDEDMQLIREKGEALKSDRTASLLGFLDLTVEAERAKLSGRMIGADNSLFTAQKALPKSLRSAETEPEMKSAQTIDVPAT